VTLGVDDPRRRMIQVAQAKGTGRNDAVVKGCCVDSVQLNI
jgi:hypothetical protein